MGGLKFDDDDLEVHISNAVKNKAQADASAWYALTQQVADLETKGDLRTLQGMLVATNKKYSNEKNEESSLINNAILRIKKQKQDTIASNYVGAKGAQKEAVRFHIGNTYINKLVRGEKITEADLNALAGANVDLPKVVERRFEMGLDTPKTVVALASDPAMDIKGTNPYALLIKKKADMAINALSAYEDPQAKLPTKETIDAVFGDVAALYEADPSVFMKASSTGKKSTNTEKLDAIFLARASGIPFEAILGARRNLKALESSGKLKQLGYNKLADLEQAINERNDFPMDSYSKTLMLIGASHMINHLGTDLDTALSCAENVFMKGHSKIGNAFVPKPFLQTSLSTPIVDTELLTELIKKDASEVAKTKGRTKKRKVGQFRFNSALKCLEVFEDDFTLEPLKAYSGEDLKELYLGRGAEIFKEDSGWKEQPIKALQAVKSLQKYGTPH